MTTGQLIQQMRKRMKLSQKELGLKLGVSGSMIGQYENDLRNPKQETLQRIADALGVTVDYLMGVTDTPRPDSTLKKTSFPFIVSKRDMFITPDAIEANLRESNPELFEYENEPGYKALICIDEALTKLNGDGISEAVKRVEELTEIPRYQKQKEPPQSD